MDSYLFYKKYKNDLRGDQVLYFEGDIPSYCPSLKHQATTEELFGLMLELLYLGIYKEKNIWIFILF